MRVPFIIPDGGGFVKLDAGWIFRYHGPDDEVMTMPQEPDYRAAYEILDEALREADRILRRARLRVVLRMEQADSGRTPEDAPPPDAL